MEQEDEGAKKVRLLREQEEENEIKRILEQEDITWEERKKREQELILKKRRRESTREEDGEPNQHGGRRNTKKLRFSILEEDWGEQETTEEQIVTIVNPTLLPKPGRKRPAPHTNMSIITDYFRPIKKGPRMEQELDQSWLENNAEQEEWENWVDQWMLTREQNGTRLGSALQPPLKTGYWHE